MIKIIPAIDLRHGKVVRLIHGDVRMETIYSSSPLEMAQRWAAYGVEMIHVVDLDGAIKGRLVNFDMVANIAKKIKVKIEFGGGIREKADVKRALDAGIEKVVIGTKALDDKFMSELGEEYGDRVVVGIDAKEGIVHTKGWLFKTELRVIDLAEKIKAAGIKTINYTDISRDGTLEGPNINSLRELLRVQGLNIVASGGVSNIKDIKLLKTLEKEGLSGIIIGKALYEHKIDLSEAIEVCGKDAY